jgi:hypothetical protein
LNEFHPGIDSWATKEFVDFWRLFYRSKKYPENPYIQNLNIGRELTAHNVHELLAWKFGAATLKPQEKKARTSDWNDIVRENLEWLNECRNKERFDEITLDLSLKKALETVRIVNRDVVMAVFLLHIARPSDIPMFDQHVHRAWHFVCHCDVIKPVATLESYIDYQRFFSEFCEKSQSRWREVDKALMSFGEFLCMFCDHAPRYPK